MAAIGQHKARVVIPQWTVCKLLILEMVKPNQSDFDKLSGAVWYGVVFNMECPTGVMFELAFYWNPQGSGPAPYASTKFG